jgi:hypothetical protein
MIYLKEITMSKRFYVPEARLNRAMNQFPERFASISEYAAAAGLDVAVVMGLLEPFFEDGSLYLELVNGETFLLTAPMGRPCRENLSDVPANLWERLRLIANPSEAYDSWKLMRGMERGGWSVRSIDAKESRLRGGVLQARVGSNIFPVVPYSERSSLVSPIGILAEAARADHRAIIITCALGELDEVSTEIRRYLLEGRGKRIYVLVLEAPSFNPILFSINDNAVLPKSISRSALEKEIVI